MKEFWYSLTPLFVIQNKNNFTQSNEDKTVFQMLVFHIGYGKISFFKMFPCFGNSIAFKDGLGSTPDKVRGHTGKQFHQSLGLE